MGLLETDITNVFCLFGLLGHSFFCFLFDCPPWTILGIYSRVIHPPIKKTYFMKQPMNEPARLEINFTLWLHIGQSLWKLIGIGSL